MSFDVTLRVGCSLSFEASGQASLVLNACPQPGGNHRILSESSSWGENLPIEPMVDEHGNRLSRVCLRKGTNAFRHDAVIAVSSRPDNDGMPRIAPCAPEDLPAATLKYTLPSRYCDSDKLADFAWEKFGRIPHGHARVNAISLWVHENIEYRYASGRPDLSAWDVLQRGYGVCRDFAHLVIALNRTFNLPARYVTGHLPDIGFPDPDNHMDFHAYAEVFVGGRWFTTDARFHVPRIGRIKLSHGYDAINGAFATVYGAATLTYFQVWAYQVKPGSVNIGDPLDFSQRLDNRREVITDASPTRAPGASDASSEDAILSGTSMVSKT